MTPWRRLQGSTMVPSVEYSDSTLTERPSTAKTREVLKNQVHSGDSYRKGGARGGRYPSRCLEGTRESVAYSCGNSKFKEIKEFISTIKRGKVLGR